MTRQFTGRHMLLLMVGFFGVVIAVNLVMATYATRTFGGTVVDNSYVASQKYNTWLGAAREQAATGWTAALRMGSGRVTVVAASDGMPLSGAKVTAIARHPLGRAPDIALAFDEVASGRFVAARALPAGRWLVHVTIRRDGLEHVLLGEVT